MFKQLFKIEDCANLFFLIDIMIRKTHFLVQM